MSLQGRRRRRVCGLFRDMAEFAEDLMRDTHVEFGIGPITDQNIPIRKLAPMQITLTDIQQTTASIAVEDRRGNPASVMAPPTWAASDPAGLTVTPATDGLSAAVLANGPLGAFQVTVTGDGGPNVGDDPFTGVLDVQVVSSKATQVVFSAVPATDQPVTPPAVP